MVCEARGLCGGEHFSHHPKFRPGSLLMLPLHRKKFRIIYYLLKPKNTPSVPRALLSQLQQKYQSKHICNACVRL